MVALSGTRTTLYLVLLAVFVISQPILAQTFAATTMNFGDQNVEQWSSTIGGNMVQAYTMFTITQPTVIQSVSMFVQYAGSDGSQCIKFGIYQDNGNGSPAGQPLVAATQNAYCLHGSASWGPAWETWKLVTNHHPDYLVINQTGSYWLATLAAQTYGSIYHYAYAQDYDYTYGYSNYFFPSPYENGFPQTFSSNPAWESNGPYSIYVTGIPL